MKLQKLGISKESVFYILNHFTGQIEENHQNQYPVCNFIWITPNTSAKCYTTRLSFVNQTSILACSDLKFLIWKRADTS